MAGNAGETQWAGRRPTADGSGRPAGPTAGVEAVLRLAEGLPALQDVRSIGEHDSSGLTATEQQQKAQTEDVIGAALAAGDAAVWVVAQGLERAAKGRWWRSTHDSFGAYVEARIGRSAGYGRRLRMNAPLALETARRTGTVPKPSQVSVTRKTEQQHGLDAAVTLYEVVRDVSAERGERTTAESLMAVHNSLPARLPDQTDAQRAAIERAARRTLGAQQATSDPCETPPEIRMAGYWPIRIVDPDTLPAGAALFEHESNKGAPIGALSFDGESNKGVSSEAPVAGGAASEGDGGRGGAQHAGAVPECLVALKEALRMLNAVNQSITRDTFEQVAATPAHARECEEIRQAIIAETAAIRNKAQFARTD